MLYAKTYDHYRRPGAGRAWPDSFDGRAVYAWLVEIKGLSHKTTLLGGNWDPGERVISVFGFLWILPAVRFVIAALGLLAGWEWWKPLLVGVTVFSLALTSVDWSNAFVGAIFNIVILSLFALGPWIASWFS